MPQSYLCVTFILTLFIVIDYLILIKDILKHLIEYS
jgi:hypothetical protein